MKAVQGTQLSRSSPRNLGSPVGRVCREWVIKAPVEVLSRLRCKARKKGVLYW